MPLARLWHNTEVPEFIKGNIFRFLLVNKTKKKIFDCVKRFFIVLSGVDSLFLCVQEFRLHFLLKLALFEI